ncbi:MAG TPA: hypothetical protein VF600_07785 [Abditibacteriaceae bacterium]|jgi:hypothetical protein
MQPPAAYIQQVQLLCVFIAGIVAIWVAFDALRRGKTRGAAIAWGMGVFMVLIVFLPLYLVMRDKTMQATPVKTEAAPCRYCGMAVPANAAYCPHCSRQLLGSESIHRRR